MIDMLTNLSIFLAGAGTGVAIGYALRRTALIRLEPGATLTIDRQVNAQCSGECRGAAMMSEPASPPQRSSSAASLAARFSLS
jgi:hypothetical protein